MNAENGKYRKEEKRLIIYSKICNMNLMTLNNNEMYSLKILQVCHRLPEFQQKAFQRR